jgi:hypothetical protein
MYKETKNLQTWLAAVIFCLEEDEEVQFVNPELRTELQRMVDFDRFSELNREPFVAFESWEHSESTGSLTSTKYRWRTTESMHEQQHTRELAGQHTQHASRSMDERPQTTNSSGITSTRG